MSERSVTFYRWDDMPKENLSEVLDRRLITADRVMLAHVYLKKGAVVPRHSHENEQITYILEGGLRFWIGPDESEVIDVFGQPIPGLYAAGEVTGGFHGAGYMSGTALAKAAIFGRIAGSSAASR